MKGINKILLSVLLLFVHLTATNSILLASPSSFFTQQTTSVPSSPDQIEDNIQALFVQADHEALIPEALHKLALETFTLFFDTYFSVFLESQLIATQLAISQPFVESIFFVYIRTHAP